MTGCESDEDEKDEIRAQSSIDTAQSTIDIAGKTINQQQIRGWYTDEAWAILRQAKNILADARIYLNHGDYKTAKELAKAATELAEESILAIREPAIVYYEDPYYYYY